MPDSWAKAFRPTTALLYCTGYPVSRLTRLVLAHRRLVVLVWLAALLAGGYASSVLSRHLSQSFAIPGTASQRANNAIIGLYGSGGRETPLAAVVQLRLSGGYQVPGAVAPHARQVRWAARAKPKAVDTRDDS